MKTLTFRVLDSGRIPEGTRHTLSLLFPAYAGKVLRLSISEAKETASDKQRRYYFGVIVEAFVDYFQSQGKSYTKDQMHDSMMRSIGGFNNPFVNPFTGEPDEGRLSYNDLTTAQAEGYHTLCLKQGAEYGFQIPLPNEVDYEAIYSKGS